MVALILLLLLTISLIGFDPKDQRSGLRSSGQLATAQVTDWSFTDQHEEILVQTNTQYGIPHSITNHCTDYDGEFYLFSAYYRGGNFPEDRAWNRNVIWGSRVRLTIGDTLYYQQLSVVTDLSLRAAVHTELLAKYFRWKSPGLDQVYMFQVDSLR